MTDTSTEGLVERLQSASEGSQKLDAGIHCIVNNYGEWSTHGHSSDGLGFLEYSYLTNDGERLRYQNPPPHYTTSIDATRSLSNWVLIAASDIGADGLAYVKLGNPATSPSQEVMGIHADLVMAWCIAALKAREAQG